MMEKYCIRKASNSIEYWAGKNWTVIDSEIMIYDCSPVSLPIDGKIIVLNKGKDYPSDEAIFERVNLLCSNVFGKCLVELLSGKAALADSSVIINTRIEIFWSEDTRLPNHAINGSTLEPGYLVGVLRSLPGSRWIPPDWDIDNLGTYSSLEDAVKKVVKLEAVFRINDYLDYEADMHAAKADEEFESVMARDYPRAK